MVPFFMMAQTQVPPGPVSGIWDLSGSPYMVNGEITVNASETLTIEPGVEVRFTDWYKFNVYGSLFAEGTETDSIRFTVDDTTYRWHGIRVELNSETIILDYCIIEYGLAEGGFPDNAGGGICIYNCPGASITIRNSRIQHNSATHGGGVECDGASPTIDNCIITHNTAISRGGGIQLFSPCNPVVKNSTFSYNHAANGGGFTCDSDCSAEFSGNTIIHNTASEHGGGLGLMGSVDFIAKNNLIAYNSAYSGGGIAFFNVGDGDEFSDNTIVYNTAATIAGAIGLAMNCAPSFTSDIMYFNTASGFPSVAYLQ
jgi:hypothetical protein